MDNSAASLKNLCKSFQGVAIVDRVNPKIERCDFFGLLGPNNAGNSTVITILTTMLRPSAGIASIMGRNIAQDKDAVRICIDLIFQDAMLDSKLIGREIPDLHARLHKVDRDKRRKRIDEVLDIIDMRESVVFDVPMSKWWQRGLGS
jgi:ABC-2 type transport system ATP-binding protein